MSADVIRLMPSSRQGHVSTSVDAGLSLQSHSLAGGLTSAMIKAILYPLDTWKSRIQVHRAGACTASRSSSSLVSLWASHGVYRGFVVKVMLHSPYQALYMASYVRTRDVLSGMMPTGSQAGLYMISGVTAELTASVIRLPMDVMKVRCQTGVYKSSQQAISSLLSNPRSFYRLLLPQTILHDCPFSACSWAVFECCRHRLLVGRQEAVLSAHENLLLGCAAGGLTAFTTTPLDVLKTRMVTRQPGDLRYMNIRSSIRTILKTEGVSSFWKGSSLRMAQLAPAHGLYMVIFDALKQIMCTYDFSQRQVH